MPSCRDLPGLHERVWGPCSNPAIELLEENLAGQVRLSDLARECGLSISHFGRSFRATFGMSAHKWLVHRRVERTKALMTQTGESLAEIADRAGFADQAAFTRAFRQIVGVSPGRWRRDHGRPDRLHPR